MNIHDWLDGSAARLIARAARAAPERCSERLHEEWLAHAVELPSPASRLRFAMGCWWAVKMINRQAPDAANVVSSSAVTADVVMTAYAAAAVPLFSRQTNPGAAANLLCDINTTPLIDVMLVLLITLILTLPVLTHAVKIDLPQGPPPTATVRPPVIDLDIDFDGTVEWNGTVVQSMQQLGDFFRAEALKIPQPEIHLRPNSYVRYDFVAKVLALAQRNGLKKVGFVSTGTFRD
ncbi:MAG TPA: biopolymer transporter ExbD [Steroidobacteraceae bacterium]|jgi:biopolymer transport protein ExbD|nr:biopolymer transporter ExbD [Steroidobacteraceae bacterium]